MAVPSVCSFNTQPPEGGWGIDIFLLTQHPSFNTQPPEGGWKTLLLGVLTFVCFNTQPPEGGWPFRTRPLNPIQ